MRTIAINLLELRTGAEYHGGPVESKPIQAFNGIVTKDKKEKKITWTDHTDTHHIDGNDSRTGRATRKHLVDLPLGQENRSWEVRLFHHSQHHQCVTAGWMYREGCHGSGHCPCWIPASFQYSAKSRWTKSSPHFLWPSWLTLDPIWSVYVYFFKQSAHLTVAHHCINGNLVRYGDRIVLDGDFRGIRETPRISNGFSTR